MDPLCWSDPELDVTFSFKGDSTGSDSANSEASSGLEIPEVFLNGLSSDYLLLFRRSQRVHGSE